MTLSDVIDTLQTWIRNADDEYDREEMGRVAGLKEALHEIKKIEPCNDAISRQAVLEIQTKYTEHIGATKFWQMRDDIKELPSVTPQPKTGHWVKYCIPRCGEQHYQCALCQYYINFGQWGEVYTKQFKYCPNCGAKMIKPQESEDKQ